MVSWQSLAAAGLVAGFVTSHALAAPASDIEYVRIGPGEFSPDNSADALARPAGRLYVTEGSGVFTATPHLPSGALLRSVQFDYCDSNDVGKHLDLSLADCDSFGACATPLIQLQSVADSSRPCSSQVRDLTNLRYIVGNTSRQLLASVTFGARDRSNQLAGLVIGYTRVRQGVGRTVVWQGEDSAAFNSPMIIETPFFIAEADPKRDSGRWFESREQLSDYRCEGVAISALHMKLKKEVDGNAVVTVKAVLQNPHSHDKSVKLDFEVFNGSESAATFQLVFRRVEETDTAKNGIDVTIPRSKLIRDPLTMMRIKMSVVDE